MRATSADVELSHHVLKVGISKSIESPYTDKPAFNATKHWDETGIPAVGDIIRKMGELASYLPIPSMGTPEYEKSSEESYQTLSLEAFKILNERNVGMAQFKNVFDSLKAVISVLEDLMMKQVTGHRHEIMSRLFGAKNPGTDKFDGNYATYQNLTELLEKTRQETGNNQADYFNITKE